MNAKTLAKKSIKFVVKNMMPDAVKTYKSKMRNLQHRHNASLLDAVKNTRVYFANNKIDACEDYVRQMSKMLAKITIDTTAFYVYPYDTWKQRELQCDRWEILSMTVDYATVLDSSLQKLSQRLVQCHNVSFKKNELRMVESIHALGARIQKQLQHSGNSRAKQLAEYYAHMLDARPFTLDEALQKILFYNALFWQANHKHNALGRLDLILSEYYAHDINAGILTRDSAKEMLRQFATILGKDMAFKSVVLTGDTGQYILLGGVDKNRNTIQNELTEIFLELFTELKVPDPKLILRVNEQTSDAIWRQSIDCITTGCGSPLIMNEQLIMNGMIEFGYKKEDVWNVGTSACWEPLIIGKSFDQNNPFPNVPVLKALNDVVLSNATYPDFDTLLDDVKSGIAQQIKDIVHDIKFDVSPLYTLFFDSCIEREKDYTLDGADYAYHGVQIVSFPNLINALLNVKKYVFEQHILSLEDCRQSISSNFADHEDIRVMLQANELKYGSTHPDVLHITNNLMDFISHEVTKYTCNGQKLKVGFSSSQYMSARWAVTASLDGRKDFEPFAVHISPVSQKIDIQEVLDFAGSLNYSGNRMNGNVVDFIIPSAFIKSKDKLTSILRKAMTSGVYELQLNVLDAATLKDAKLHPEKYPNLVVRVWGFSAYFNDLPEEYKDHLIARAEAYE